MIPIDLHTHTEFSCDAKSSMSMMARSGMQAGVQALGFSEHFDLLPDDPCAGFFEPAAWWEALARCRDEFDGHVSILAGIEIGEPHRFQEGVQQLLGLHDWDYALGSLHWVGDDLIFARSYYEQPPDLAYRRYFHELAVMAREGDFDILAHMDIVKRYGFDYYGPFDPRRYEDEIRQVLQTCVQRGIALEINTSTLRRPVNEPSPSPTIVSWYLEQGGSFITLGSDAHHPEHVGHGLAQVLTTLRRDGVSQLSSFRARNPVPTAIHT